MLYLGLARYTNDALAGVGQGGYASRRTATAQLCESLGGRLAAMHFTLDDEWSLMAMMTLPDSDAAFAFRSLGRSMGILDRLASIELRTPEEADAAISCGLSSSRPGQHG